jgi:hypothetical protein
MGKPFPLLALRAAYPETILLRSVFKLAAELEHENCPERGLAAGMLQIIVRAPKLSSMLAPRNSFPKFPKYQLEYK